MYNVKPSHNSSSAIAESILTILLLSENYDPLDLSSMVIASSYFFFMFYSDFSNREFVVDKNYDGMSPDHLLG